ncbi:RNA-binding S4 domain-containing protein [Streptomyces uncialis]|uniref:RNA-binding S4 domain-containing protein n=1 Tax=Streptomyces uncialis TaxID=1048205 RepID=UPI003867B10A|nr:RNA-binding S4 domain-containing protein [Streptomyces uncialis]
MAPDAVVDVMTAGGPADRVDRTGSADPTDPVDGDDSDGFHGNEEDMADGDGSDAADAVGSGPAGRTVAPDPSQGSVRVDVWIWSVRLVKSRSLAAAACRGGHVRVNGERVKPAYALRVGDEVRLKHAGHERVVVVKRIIRKRVGAPAAVECFLDNSPPPPPREAVAPAGVRDRGAGRPTKRDRREMDRLREAGGVGITRGPAEPDGFAAAAGSAGAAERGDRGSRARTSRRGDTTRDSGDGRDNRRDRRR